MSNLGELQPRYEDMRMIFDTVLRSLEHEDSKANRLIVVMAFITVASATIFAHLYTPAKSAWEFGIGHMDWVAVFFYIYLGLVLLGTLFVMAALGPRLNIPRVWPRSATPPSRLFFWKIAETDRKQWMKHVLETDAQELRELITEDLASEAHLLAQKNSYKVSMMSIGRHLYRYSFATLLAFVAFGLTHSGMLGLGIVLLCLALIFMHHAFEVYRLPKSPTGGRSLDRCICLKPFAEQPFASVMLVIGLVLFALSLSFLCLS